MKDIVISKLPKPGESMVPHIHPFPQNYTHNLIHSHEIIPLFSPQDTTKQTRTHTKTRTNLQARTNAHAGPQAKKRMCRRASTCRSADRHICTGLYVRACTHAEAHTLAFCTCTHTCMFVCVGVHTQVQAHIDPRASSFARACAHTQECTLRLSLMQRCARTRLRTGTRTCTGWRESSRKRQTQKYG